MKSKIVFFLPNLTVGGAEQITLNFIKNLDKNKFEVILVVISNEWDLIKELPLDIEVIRFNISRTIKSIFKISSFIKEREPDIVFTSLIHSSIAIYLALLANIKKPKIILRSPSSPKLLIESNNLVSLRKKILIRAYKSADLLIAQTPEMKIEMMKYYGIKEEKIKVFINPIDKVNINKNLQNIKNPFDETKENIVASGRLVREKGFDILIHAFALAVHKNTNLELHILGAEMEEGDSLRELVGKLDLTKEVHFLGHQYNPYRYYYFSDLYVLSSRREGLPNTVLENLYLKKPIIATRCIPFMDTLVENTKNGFLVEVGNIEELAERILEYKSLVPDNSFILKQTGDINQLIGEVL